MEAFDKDLDSILRDWSHSSDHIIVLMDANRDVRSPGRTLYNLVEICTSRHGHFGPATTSWGRAAIDGIWVFPLSGIRDHRGLWIDLPQSLFGGADLKTQRPSARRLKLDDPRIVKRFLNTYSRRTEALRLLPRAVALLEDVSGPLSPVQAALYEELDLRRTTAMLQAERQCRKLKMGMVPWSPEFTQAQRLLQYYRLCYRKSLGHKISTKTLFRAAKRAGQTPQPVPSAVARDLLLKALSSYRECKRKSTQEARATYLQSLAVAKANDGETDISAEYRTLLRREDQRYRFRLIKQAHQSVQRSGLRRVHRTLPDGTRVDCTSKEEIEAACLAENDSRFSQAKDTPFLVPPLLDEFGLLGDDATIQQVLDGSYHPPPNADEYAQRLLTHLRRDPMVSSFSMDVSAADFIEGWTRAKEQTSAGPSKLHFGHFKALVAHDPSIDLEVTLLKILLRSGYSPQRWRKGLNVMLLKKPGNYDPATFRTILLYEADFNFVLKLMGRRMMANAERFSQLAPEQYGSRKSHTAISQALNKVLTYDMLRLLRAPGALCSNDAKSCYDRIVHSVAKMSMLRLGAPSTSIDLMFSTIQRLEHFIRTAYGDSDISFGGEPTPDAPPKHGVGQGNGCGPAIWAAVSTPALQLLRASGAGVDLYSSISNSPMRMAAYSFVDDTDLPQVSSADVSPAVVSQRMQTAVDLWEGAIRATGGAIVPSKSFWYLIDFRWASDGTYAYKRKADHPAEISVLDASGHRVPLERLECKEARRTLGIRAAPNGNQEAERSYLLDTFRHWADTARTSGLDRTSSWLNLSATILRKLDYPLPATCFSRADCNLIMKPLRSFLPQLGFNRNYPDALVHGPRTLLGLDIPDLYVSQGISHVRQILTFAHLPDNLTGALIRGTIEQVKVEAGLSGPLFSHDLQPLATTITPSWIRSTWAFLNAYDITLEERTPHLRLHRQADRFLMEHFLATGYKGNQLQRLNYCRLHLQVTTLADICTGDGTRISQLAWDGKFDDSERSPYAWPRQPRPPNWIWEEWRQALSSLVDRSLRLRQPLGQWIDCSHRQWFYSPSDERLYHRQHDTWTFHPRQPRQARTRQAQTRFSVQPTSCLSPSLALEVASVQRFNQFLIMTGSGPTRSSAPGPPPGSLLGVFHSSPPGMQWAFQDVQISDDGQTIAKAIRNGCCIALSDGSVKDGHGSAAWVLEAADSTNRITGCCQVPGSPADHSSYRSEYAGLFALVAAVRLICDYHEIIEGSVTLCCDGLGPLRRASKRDWLTIPTEESFDLKEATRVQMDHSPVDWQFRHVRGHQDASKPISELDRYERLNCEMDALAKSFRVRLPNSVVWPVDGEPWAIWLQGHKICSDAPAAVKKHCSWPRTLEYWKAKGRFGTGNPQMINWDHQERALRSIPQPRLNFMSKQASGFSGVGKMMARMRYWSSAACVRCDEPEESTEHVLKCPQPEATQTWADALQSLSTHLSSVRTDPMIVTAIVESLQAWRQDTTPLQSHPKPLILAALTAQNSLGWRPFLEGLPCHQWTVAQAHFARMDPRFSPGLWATRLIRWVWEIPWALWSQRNKHLHDGVVPDPAMLDVDNKIRDQVRLGVTGLNRASTLLFRKYEHSILQQSPEIRRVWLTRISKARDQDPERGMRQIMRQWLRPSQAPQPLP